MDPFKPRNEGPAAISGMVGSLLKKLGLDRRFKESSIKKDWENWVGRSIATHAVPYRVVNKKLVVYVDSSVWLTELRRYYKGTILKRVQDAVGKEIIKDLIFKIGEIPEEEKN